MIQKTKWSRILGCVLAISILLSLASAASADEIRFLNIEWLSNVRDVKAMVKDKLTKDLPTGEFELSTWTARAYKGDGNEVKDVPMYKLEYCGRYYYQVAGLNVKSIDLEFVPKGADGTYSDKDTDGYQLTLARYCFDKDNINDHKDVYAALEKKLRALYGEPVASLDGSDYSAYFSQTTKGFAWEGDNNTIVKLHYSSAYTSITGTIEGVYITYAYGDKAFFEEKAALTLVSEGEGNVDVGQTDGL